MRRQAAGSHPDLASALVHLIDAGGKRIRPAVSLLTGGMLGADPQRLLDLAAAVELLHTATLVHDDLIDGALLRRGMPTLNANWTPAATVLTGDFIFARAARLAAATESVDVVDRFAQTLTIIVDGEIAQHFRDQGPASRKGYFQRIYAKTASLFELASGAAALLSPVDPDVQSLAADFGRELGMAFQIVDDVLDFTGDERSVGKPVGSDLRQGLITLPAICYGELHPEDPDLNSVMNRNGHTHQQLDRLIENIRRSGAAGEALEEARRYVNRAVSILEGMPGGSEQAALVDLARYIVDRET